MSENMFTGGTEGYEEGGKYVNKMIAAPSAAIVQLKKASWTETKNKKTPQLELIFTAIEPTEGLDGDYGAYQFARNRFWLTPNAMDPTKLGSCVKFLSLLAENLGGPDTNEFQKERSANLLKWNEKCSKLEANDWDGYVEAIMDFFEGKSFAAALRSEHVTNAKNGKVMKFSELNFMGTFARVESELPFLQKYVEDNEEYLITDNTVPQGLEQPVTMDTAGEDQDW